MSGVKGLWDVALCRHLCFLGSSQRSREGGEWWQELLLVFKYLSPCAALLPTACLLLRVEWVNGQCATASWIHISVCVGERIAVPQSQQRVMLLTCHRATERGEAAEAGGLPLMLSMCGTVLTWGPWPVPTLPWMLLHYCSFDTGIIYGFMPSFLCRWGPVLVQLHQFKCWHCSVKSALFIWGLSFTKKVPTFVMQ